MKTKSIRIAIGSTCLATCALLSIGIACANAQQPLLTPAWTREVIDIATPVSEFPAPGSESWTRTADGGFLLALFLERGARLSLHRFDAAGALIQNTIVGATSGSSPYVAQRMLLRADLQGGAWIAMHAANGMCELLHVSVTGTLIGRFPEFMPCTALDVGADSDLLVVSPTRLRRVGPDGSERWRSEFFDGASVSTLIDRDDGQIWLIGGGGAAVDGARTLFRFDAQGQLLGTDLIQCATCGKHGPASAVSLPDGGALIATNSPASLFRFSADGTQRWASIFPASGAIESLHVDGDGNVVLGDGTRDLYFGVDANDGGERWRFEARELVTTTTGAIALVGGTGGVAASVVTLRSDGSEVSRSQLSLDGLQAIGQLRAAPGGGAHALATFAATTPQAGCIGSPRLLYFGASSPSQALAQVQVCGERAVVSPHRFMAAPNERFLLRANFGLESYAADGRFRWRYETCAECPPPPGRQDKFVIESVVPTRDGGAWVLESESVGAIWSIHDRLRRLDPYGRPAAEHSLRALSHIDDATMRMVADEDSAMLFWGAEASAWGDIGWAWFDAAGNSASGSVPVIPYGRMQLRDARRLENGDVLLTVIPDANPFYCSSPECGRIRVSLLRVRPTGTIVWRHDSEIDDGYFVDHDPSGATWIASAYAPHRVQHIADRGWPDAEFSVQGILGNDGLYGIVAGDASGVLMHQWGGLRLLDADGRSVATMPATQRVFQDVSLHRTGYLGVTHLDPGGPQAILLDASDLVMRAAARMPAPDGSLPVDIVRTLATITQDGVIAIAEARNWPDGLPMARVAAFVVPGTPAADRILSDGFEP